MKKLTLFFTALLSITTIVIAQTKLYVYQTDGSCTEFLAASVDSIIIGESDNTHDDDVNANGYKYVDLGLPSGILWATCNVGANTPEESGDYFAWGEIIEKDEYNYETYKWYNINDAKYTKYCTISDFGRIDNRTILELLDDAANVNWGGNWRMPTREEFYELKDNCIWEFSSINNVPGYKIISKVNGNSIFIPAVGYYSGSEKIDEGVYGYYRTTSLSTYHSLATFFYFNSDKVSVTEELSRSYGMTVRPVLGKNFSYEIKFESNGAEMGTMSSVAVKYSDLFKIPNNNFYKQGYEFIGWNTMPDGTGIGYDNQESFSIVSSLTLYAQWYKSETNITHEYVDLGLSVKWATCNIGASKPEESGYYFAWGETKPKAKYSLNTHKWCNGTPYSYTKYCTNSTYGTVDNKLRLDSSDDAAIANWGGNWRMPSDTELKELYNECTWTWGNLNGVRGYTVTGPNGNSIFLPVVGYKDGSVHERGGSASTPCGVYWTSNVYGYYSYLAYSVELISNNRKELKGSYRYQGYQVRPVLP